MRKLTLFILLCACALCAHAETLVLRTGARVQGTIVFQNEEVVIIRNAEGARFQYPRADIEQVLTDEEAQVTAETQTEEEAEEIRTSKKASILLEVSAGAAMIPHERVGAAVNADLLVGSHHIGDKHIFVGGGLGYHGVFMGETKYNFLPIQAAVRLPFIEQKHAPVGGLAVGYGIALSKTYLGGLFAGIDIGYRCQLNPKTAIGAVAFAQFQQAKVKTTETVNGAEFTNEAGRNIFSVGAKLMLYF